MFKHCLLKAAIIHVGGKIMLRECRRLINVVPKLKEANDRNFIQTFKQIAVLV